MQLHEALAESSGLSPGTIRGIMRPGRSVRVSTMEKLCTGFGMTMGQFFNLPVFDSAEKVS